MQTPSEVGLQSPRLQAAVCSVLCAYLVLAWFGGGPTLDVTPVDEWLGLLAWVPLLMSAWLLCMAPTTSRLQRLALLAAFLLPVIPWLQLVPLPGALLATSSAREAVTTDLAAADISPGASHAWSLWPETTVRSAHAVLPAVACFLAALVVGPVRSGLIALLALGLVLANLVFGFFQAGLPANSAMRLYADNGTGFGGVFVNGNHQATALIIGMLVALGLLAREVRWQKDRGQPRGAKTAAYAAAVLVCLAAVPLTGSSAGMIIAVVGLGIGVFATGLVRIRRLSRTPASLAATAAAVVLLVVGLVSVQRWMDLRSTDAMRYGLAREVIVLGQAHAPFGSGVGTFVDTFAQGASPAFQRIEYVNHAHNEYAQWWLEAGWPAVLMLLFVFGILLAAGWRLVSTRPRDPVAIASWLAVACVLIHSLVDFPLRTTALMSMAGLLAGLAIAAASRPPVNNRGPREPVRALQQA